MQKIMFSMMGTVNGTMVEVKVAKVVAQEAKDMASQAKEAAAAFGGTVETMKKELATNAVTKEELPAMVREITATMVDPWAQAAGKGNLGKAAGKGKGGGKAEKRAEERTCTISFSNFPKGTKADAIKDFIKEKLGDYHAEDVYTYDQRATKGMARFETPDIVWEYIVSDAGKQKLEFQGRRIYADKGEDAKRERAVRKTVYLLIKHGGGDGEAIKKDLDISYRIGEIWRGDTQLAERNEKDQKMRLMGVAANFTTEVNTMMEE